MELLFDRGTLLCVAPPAGLDVEELPGFLWDPRVSSHRAPAFRYAQVVAFLAARGARFTDRARAPGPPPERWEPPELRPYQRAALDAWERNGRRGLVVLPTGSGKTRLALAAIAGTGLRTLCLVPTRVLLEQWRGALAASYPGRVGVYGDGVRELQPITVATFESAYRHMPTIGGRFELLVVDEAHHFGGGARDDALEAAIAPARLGLTATPPRDGQAARLAALLGPTVFELSLGALSGTFLAELTRIVITLGLDAQERRAYDAEAGLFRAAYSSFRRLAPGARWEDFTRFASRTDDGRRALAAWRRSRRIVAYTREKELTLGRLLQLHRGSRVLVFTADNETAYAVARRHLVMPLTCDIGKAERACALARFRAGELRALVSSRVLNEGMDVPDAEVAVVVGAAQGEREHVQRVGRVLRPAPGKRALLYELVTAGTAEVDAARRRGGGLGGRKRAAAAAP